jgi:protein MPE1
VPDHDPPNGYICYRCGNKGHWIQLCPTNDDPDFDNRPRVKRTTGIPRSFLQKVDKSVVMAQSEGDETKRPSGIMVNAEGDFVIAEPDKASWEQYQAKAKSSGADAAAADKEIQERGLECSIDKKMFIEPMKTPCCQKTFCNDCITNALIESDFICPACQSEGVLIDDLQPDEDASKKIQDYLKEKEAAKAASPPPQSPKAEAAAETNSQVGDKPGDAAEKNASDAPAADGSENKETPQPTEKPKSESPTAKRSTSVMSPIGSNAEMQAADGDKADAAGSGAEGSANSNKRPADELLENPKIPKGPRAMQNQQAQNNMNMMGGMNGMGGGMGGMNGMNGMNNMMYGMPMMPNMMGMPNMNMGMGMGMPNMGMPNMGMPNMGMPNMGMPMMGMPNFGNNMNGGGGSWGMNGGGMNNMGNMGGGYQGNNNFNGGGDGGFQGQFQGQQGNGAGGDEDAYFRKPVNPHRHQNKQRRVRPSDYRELQ